MYSDVKISQDDLGAACLTGKILDKPFFIRWNKYINEWNILSIERVSLPNTLYDIQTEIDYLTEYMKLARMGREEATQYLRTKQEARV